MTTLCNCHISSVHAYFCKSLKDKLDPTHAGKFRSPIHSEFIKNTKRCFNINARHNKSLLNYVETSQTPSIHRRIKIHRFLGTTKQAFFFLGVSIPISVRCCLPSNVSQKMFQTSSGHVNRQADCAPKVDSSSQPRPKRELK